MVHLTISDAGVQLSAGDEVVLRRQTWADYEQLLNARQDRAAIKVRYNARTQEIRIMAPLPWHGNQAAALSTLVQALLRHTGQDWQDFDPITLKRFGEAGLEPDRCFYTVHRDAILGRERIDLESVPPPDLTVEIDATSTTVAEDYEPLGVPELWIYRADSLHIYLFDGRHYREATESPTFPGIPVRRLIPKYLQRAWQAGTSVALREFEKALGEAP